MKIKDIARYALLVLFIVSTVQATARVAENNFSSSIALKIPGNNAAHYPLQEIRKGDVVQLKANQNIIAIKSRVNQNAYIQIYSWPGFKLMDLCNLSSAI